MRVSALNGQEWARRMSAVTGRKWGAGTAGHHVLPSSSSLSSGLAGEGAEVGHDTLPSPHSYWAIRFSLTFYCIDSDIYRYERYMLRFYGPLL